MQVLINDLSTGNTLCRKSYPGGFITPNGIDESEGEINFQDGKLSYCESCFEGIRVVSADVDASRPVRLGVTSDSALYFMLYCLEGDIQLLNADKASLLGANQGLFSYSPAGTTIYDLAYSKLVIVQLTREYYHRFTNGDEKYKITEAEPVLRINPAMQMILKSIGECTHSALMRRIFLETGVLQLLLLQLEQVHLKRPPAVRSVKDHDVERIQFARALIEDDIRNPCSLIELAHKAGLNDFKLKKGFKETYGTTVFGYLHELRMTKAWKMLSEEKKSVNDVSYEVGYKNPHHFTAAFRKKYGVLPGKLNK